MISPYDNYFYLTSDYDLLVKEQGFPGYADYYKLRSDKIEGNDVAKLNIFVQLLEIDFKLGSKNEDQLAGLLTCAFPSPRFINVHFSENFCLKFLLMFRLFQLPIILQRI